MSMFYLHTKKSRSRYGDGGDEKGQTAERTGYVLRGVYVSIGRGARRRGFLDLAPWPEAEARSPEKAGVKGPVFAETRRKCGG
ncbi:MAG: hypothetical protein CR217_18960 [Beijerinckiaceae bacterium]|nr:MAG: hypothetical protein CR217_18960 [Beijerinckiaceae bacterium]